MNVIGLVYHVAGNNYPVFRSYGLSIITLGRLLNTALGIGHVDLALDGFSLSCSFFPGLFFRISLGLFDLCEPFFCSTQILRKFITTQMDARYFKIEDLKADTLVDVLREDLCWYSSGASPALGSEVFSHICIFSITNRECSLKKSEKLGDLINGGNYAKGSTDE